MSFSLRWDPKVGYNVELYFFLQQLEEEKVILAEVSFEEEAFTLNEKLEVLSNWQDFYSQLKQFESCPEVNLCE